MAETPPVGRTQENDALAHALAVMRPLALWLVLFALGRGGVRSLAPYMLGGVVLWLLVLRSGVHATLAETIAGLGPARVYRRELTVR